MRSSTPKLRSEISAHPVRYQGELLFKLFDTSGISSAELAVSPPSLFVAMQLDGATSILDIQDRFARETDGVLLPSDKIEEVLDSLDKAFFLAGERFDRYEEKLRKEFFAAESRPALSVGASYAEDPATLGTELDTMLAEAPPPEEPTPAAPRPQAAPPGIVIPHIDYGRGAAGYGQAYRELADREPPDAVVILGTGHRPMTNRVAICDKAFAVPGGAVQNARDVTQALLEACRPVADFATDALAHLPEHSIELQAVWLRHIWSDRVRIVPVLVGAMEDFLQAEADPSAAAGDPQLCALVGALTDLRTQGRTLMLLASADLAHVGPYFQDERNVDEPYLKEVEEADRQYLAAVASGEPLAGLQALQRVEDRYHVCGAGCIHVLNAVLEGVSGRLLGYHQAATPQMQQAVTYAAVLFE